MGLDSSNVDPAAAQHSNNRIDDTKFTRPIFFLVYCSLQESWVWVGESVVWDCVLCYGRTRKDLYMDTNMRKVTKYSSTTCRYVLSLCSCTNVFGYLFVVHHVTLAMTYKFLTSL